MSRHMFITGDHAREKTRTIDYALWIDASKGPKSAPGYVSSVADVSADEQAALEAGAVLEQRGTIQTNIGVDDKNILDSIRKLYDEAQARWQVALELDRQGPLAGWSE